MSKRLLVAATLTALILLVYWQLLSSGFVLFDDPGYVSDNARVQAGLSAGNVLWALSATDMANWHPLTWLSYMADCSIFGPDPMGHHLVNILLHIANTLLLLFFLDRITGAFWRSAFVAALFALHPLHVESVAWISERKDVLSTLFFMLTLLAYAFYAERPGTARYLGSLGAFALGLAAKPMLVTVPFLRLLLDYWPLGRLPGGWATAPGPAMRRGLAPEPRPVSRLVLEKVPFLLLSVASSVVTVYAQRAGGAVSTTELVTVPLRLTNALVAYAAYIGKAFWPTRLAVLYPLAETTPGQVALACLLLAGMTAVVLRRARRAPFLPVGWFWYLGTLVPVIGLLQVGSQSMADRYTYIPLIGLFVMGAWSVPERLDRWRRYRPAVAALAVSIVLALSAATWKQAGYWKNSLTLFTRTLQVTSFNYMIHLDLGAAFYERGRIDDAIGQYREALRLVPNYSPAHLQWGIALQSQGKLAEAAYHYAEAVRLDPGSAVARRYLDACRELMGKTPGRQ